MPRIGSRHDFEDFDDWETFDIEDEIYRNAQEDDIDDWEDDGAIAEIREPQITEVDSSSAEVFSLIEHTKSKNPKELLDLGGPSEEELSRIEEVGIDDYIDNVLLEDVQKDNEQLVEDVTGVDEETEDVEIIQEEEKATELIMEDTQINISEIDELSDDIDLVVKPLFEGIAVALPTLFDEDGDVEYKTTARLAKRLSHENVAAIFVGTKEGEGNTLSRKERKNLIKTLVKSNDVLVCADVTAPSTRQSVQLADDAIDAGAKCLLVSIDVNVHDPYALCGALYENNREIPLIVNLIGDPQSIPISPEFLYDLPISGVIDSTGDISYFLHLIGVYGGPVYIGTSQMILAGHAMGATGVVLPGVAIQSELIEKAFSGDPGAQSEIAMWERETGECQTRAIKIALEADFLVSSNMRD